MNRQPILSRTGHLLAGTALVITCSLLISAPLKAQDPTEAARLKREVIGDSRFVAADTITTVVHWTGRLLGPNARREDLMHVLEWVSHAKIVVKPVGPTFNDQYSNRFGISSAAPLTLTSQHGIPFGVNIDPWMSVVGQNSGTELNLAEMAAVLSETQGDTDALLFPDTVRLEPEAKHKEAFTSFMASQGGTAGDHLLIYVRYFVGSKRGDGGVAPKPRIAYAFTSRLNSVPIIKFGPIE